MPQTTREQRQNMTEPELRDRAVEMRSEWSELTKLDRESDDFRKSKRQFMEEMEDIDVNLNVISYSTPSYRAAPKGAIAGGGDGAVQETRSIGRQLVEDEGFRAWMGRNANREHLQGESPTVELRDLVTLGTSANLTLPVQQPALIGVRRRRLFVRDLLSSSQVSQAAVPYIRELNAVANQAAATTVAEGGTKPEAKIEFTTDLAVVTVIAVNIPLTTQMLQDDTFIAGYAENRLTYMLDVREEDQLLSGNGTGANIKGILATSGVQTQAYASNAATSILNAMTKIEVLDSGVWADAVVMNPVDANAMFGYRASTSTAYDAGDPFGPLEQNVWGVRVVKTPAVTAGTAIVGNWQLGATILDRIGTFVRVYEQHSDFAVKNKVLMQAEKRVGLMVTNPDYFVTTAVVSS